MGQIKFVTSMILIALFSITVIGFATTFGNENDTSINIADDSEFGDLKTNQESQIDTFFLNSNTSVEAMYQSKIASQSDANEGGTTFKVGSLTAIPIVRNTMQSAFKKLFGSDSGFGFIFTAAFALLGLISALYIYKTWRGNPD